MDMTGIDLSQLVAREWIAYNKRGLVPDYLTGQSPLLQKMVAEGKTGRKSGSGFYEVCLQRCELTLSMTMASLFQRSRVERRRARMHIIDKAGTTDNSEDRLSDH